MEKIDDIPGTYENKYKYLVMAFKRYIEVAKKQWEDMDLYEEGGSTIIHVHGDTYRLLREILDEMESDIAWLEGEKNNAI